jgi:nucleotidyltransferase substrate binding protein (TIGR01987 family)
MEQDIRWEQRFSNYVKALTKLEQAVDYINHNYIDEDELIDADDIEDVLDEMVKEGLIQRFEYTHELAWNVMKDYALYQGNSNIGGSRDASREAFQLNLVKDGNVWMDMISSRNKSTHTYNEETAKEISTKILNEYFPAFLEFRKVMEEKRSGKQQDLFEK